jgi:hypothetical protein
MASVRSFSYGLVVGAIFLASFVVDQVSALGVEYCSSQNTAQTPSSKPHSEVTSVEIVLISWQIQAFTSPMDSATTSASTIGRSQFYKSIAAGVPTKLLAFLRQFPIATFNVADTQMICVVAQMDCSDTWL